jgi:hemolysin III
MLSKLREPVNGLTHLIASAAALLGLIVLILLSWGDVTRLISAGVFGLSLTTLFLASGLYHSIKASPEVIKRLRLFDHAAIYLLIAGTYTPICVQYLNGSWRWGLLGVVWAMALIGIIAKIFTVDAPRWLTTGIYLAMGWMAVIAIHQLVRTMPLTVIVWMAVGGAFYTLGAVGYIIQRPVLRPGRFGYHEVWHIFVILAGASHYIGIANAVAN